MRTVGSSKTHLGRRYQRNQEDSIIANQSSFQRGLFCLTSYHTIECMEKKRDMYSNEEICMPPKSTPDLKPDNPKYFRRKNANYSFLDERGIILPRQKTPDLRSFSSQEDGTSSEERKFFHPATVVKKGDVIVGKVIVKTNKDGDETRIDASVVIQQGEEGTIDRVHVITTPNGYRLVKIVIRQNRIPEIGDKLASCMAQKGTIGMLYRQEDMPFSEKGIVPDLIISPNCIPSRMTINQLVATALGKCVLLTGAEIDATPFTEESRDIGARIQSFERERPEGGHFKTNDKISNACRRMEELGYESNGWEMMRNGMTGEMMRAKIFIGPTYYQRLKHMVGDKMHARPRGQVTSLVRQACEGFVRDWDRWSATKNRSKEIEPLNISWKKNSSSFHYRNTKIDISSRTKGTFLVEELRSFSKRFSRMGA